MEEEEILPRDGTKAKRKQLTFLQSHKKHTIYVGCCVTYIFQVNFTQRLAV